VKQNSIKDLLAWRQVPEFKPRREVSIFQGRWADHALDITERFVGCIFDEQARRAIDFTPDDNPIVGDIAGHGAIWQLRVGVCGGAQRGSSVCPGREHTPATEEQPGTRECRLPKKSPTGARKASGVTVHSILRTPGVYLTLYDRQGYLPAWSMR